MSKQIRTAEYWKEYKRRKSREWMAVHKEEMLGRQRTNRQSLMRYKLSRGCYRCGYKQNAGALSFHHMDMTKKDPTWTVHSLSPRGLQEIEKCQVICENCHREVHHPDLDISVMSPGLLLL